jgi:RNA polymerase sigma-70 factor (ECF subfamily)
LRIWKARSASQINCARAFLFRVARNVAINLLQRERVSPLIAMDDLAALPALEQSPDIPALTCAREELLLLASAIDALPSRCREIMILSRVKNLTQREIAVQLNLSEETVGVQVARGVKKCVEHLRRQGVDYGQSSSR